MAKSDTRIIAVVNRKGGVAKTTTSINLAARIAGKIRDGRDVPETQKNDRVLVIDLDPQANVTAGLGLKQGNRCLGRFMLGEAKFGETVMSADRSVDGGPARPNLFVLPASGELQERLRQLDIKLYFQQSGNRRYDGPTMGNVLRLMLAPYVGHFRYIFLDCPPTLGHLDRAVYDFAQEVIVPVRMAYLDSAGAMQHLKDLRQAQEELGAGARLTWIVPTFFRPNEVLARQMLDQIKKVYRGLVAEPVPQSVVVEKSQASQQRTLFEYDPDAPATQAYAWLADKVMTQ